MNELAATAVTIIGWVGALVSLVTYIMVTQGRLSPSTVLYQGLNMAGAATLGLSAMVNGALPSAVVNVIWVIIGIFAVLSMKRHVIRTRLAAEVRRQRALTDAGRARLTAGRTRLAARRQPPARRRPVAERHHVTPDRAEPLHDRPLQPGSSRPAGRRGHVSRRARSTSPAA